MAKPIIAVDVDDVLAASAIAWVKHSNDRWDTNLTVDDYLEDWATMWQLDHVATRVRADQLFDERVLRDFDPDAQAAAVLTKLSERFTLVIATSRRTSSRDDTLEWLDKHFNGIFSDVHMSGIFDSSLEGTVELTKSEMIQRIGADYLIDDQFKHCQAVAGHGGKAILFGDYTWNRVDELPIGVTRCADWLAVGAYFDGIR